jgi:hypothetical protein
MLVYEGESGMDRRLAGAVLTAAATVLAVSACSSGSSSSFVPGGGATTAVPAAAASTAAPSSVIMPPFGKNVHILLSGGGPEDATLAQAVSTDENYELAFLYAEYTGGQADGWTAYVSSTMQTEVSSTLAQPDVTTESFRGTIRIFDMSAIRDPSVPADVDVSGCYDNVKASNTDLKTGAVLPDNGGPDSHYYRFTDQLTQTSGGQWKVVSDYPRIYYPRAKECKP